MANDLHPLWAEIAKDCPVPLAELDARIAEVLADSPELATNADATTHLFYSGYTAGESGVPQVADLVERSGGAIGSLDSTSIGQALGQYADAFKAQDMEARFAGVIDFSNEVVDYSGEHVRAENLPIKCLKTSAPHLPSTPRMFAAPLSR